MHLWSRLDAPLAAILLGAFCASWVNADDHAPRRTAAKLRSKILTVSTEDEQPSEQAARRWGQLKSRASAAEPTERAVSANPQHPRPGTPVRPIPENVPDELADDDELLDVGEWLDDETLEEPRASVQNKLRTVKSAPVSSTNEDEPLPVTEIDDEPAWIYGSTAEIADAAVADAEEAIEEAAALRNVAQQNPSDAEPAAEPVPDEQPANTDPTATDPEYVPRSGSRKPREIHEILPTYDLNYDRDIREFAKLQARQYNVETNRGPFPQRMFPGLVYQWEPSNFWHYPLYFEDPALERYGHTHGHLLQPVASIARFSTQLVGLPYQMTIDPPCCPKYVLGWYRPGECAPKLHYQVPLNAKAAAVEAGVLTGLFFAIP